MTDAYKSYFDSMPCFLSVQNRELRIIDANSRFREKFGDFEGRQDEEGDGDLGIRLPGRMRVIVRADSGRMGGSGHFGRLSG